VNELNGGRPGVRLLIAAALGLSTLACDGVDSDLIENPQDSRSVVAQVEAAVWAFHSADTARSAEGVIDLLWPEFTMLSDGQRLDYETVTTGSREFMASLELFHTVWTELEITPLGSEAAVSSFVFRDSIVTRDGELIQARGPTTLVWQRRGEEWRVLYADADHYPLAP
jgi:hypothetical protein